MATKLPRGKLKILDIGCGTGFRTHVLSKNGALVVGVDISAKNIKIARDRYPKIRFFRMSAARLRFKDATHDQVHAIDVLEHVENLSAVLSEIARVLKPGGTFTAVIPAEKSEKWLLKIRPTYHSEINHVRIFGDNQLEQLLEKRGFILLQKTRQGFLQHAELLYFFTRRAKSNSQLSIGRWNDSFASTIIHTASLFFEPYWVFNTPLRFVPIWLITLPVGWVVNLFGNKYMPKSFHYKFLRLN